MGLDQNKLSNLAAEDFERIFEYTLLNFGVKQADDYTVSMHNALLAITEQPLMGHECPEIAKELRRQNHHKHAIFFIKKTALWDLHPPHPSSTNGAITAFLSRY